jgi:hypothetical protein
LKASLNRGLNKNLENKYPEYQYKPRPYQYTNQVIDSNWLLGFIEGESCFYVSIYKSPKSKLGSAVQLVFKITQHLRDKSLLLGIANFFECGRVEKRKGEACDFVVNSCEDINNKIIPFLLAFELQGSKNHNFKCFKKVVDLMKEKKHLTKSGLEEIKEIKSKMNRNLNI